MRVSHYVEHYTHDFLAQYGRKFHRVWMEIVELLQEVARLNLKGIREEFGDVLHLTQLWLYSYGWDSELWMWCAKKFIARQAVWQTIFEYVGLSGTARISANYNREHKVITELAKFGVPEAEAREAYWAIVHKQSN